MTDPLLKCRHCNDEYLYKAGSRPRTVRTLKGVVRETLQLYICGECKRQETEVSEIAPHAGSIGWDVIEVFVGIKRTGLSYQKAVKKLMQDTGFKLSICGAHRLYRVYGGQSVG